MIHHNRKEPTDMVKNNKELRRLNAMKSLIKAVENQKPPQRIGAFTKEQAIAMCENETWKNMTYRERALFQMTVKRLCMPFEVFHEAIEKTLGRPVYTHEFGMNWEGLMDELINGKTAPTPQEIFDMLPKDKKIVTVHV